MVDVGVLGATGMVGQRFIELLDKHPEFEVKVLTASPAPRENLTKKLLSGIFKVKCQNQLKI